MADDSLGASLFAHPTSTTRCTQGVRPRHGDVTALDKVLRPTPRSATANLGVIQGPAHGGPPLSHADVDEPVFDLSKNKGTQRGGVYGITANIFATVRPACARAPGRVL